MPKQPFFKVVTHFEAPLPGLTGMCVGYEQGAWRQSALADHLMKALPDFCLSFSELTTFGPDNAVQLLRQAAKRIYSTDKYSRRGEFGELLLHVVLKEVFQTVPAITKLYFKDSANDTVKGFDAVHVVVTQTDLELWLGEVKFYDDLATAIRDVVSEINAHTAVNYLRSEFVAIQNKIDPAWPHGDRLRKLLDEGTSLDEVFERVRIPVLLTYDGAITSRHTRHTSAYLDEIAAEFNEGYERFLAAGLPENVMIHLFLVPLATKNALVRALHEKLQAWQQI